MASKETSESAERKSSVQTDDKQTIENLLLASRIFAPVYSAAGSVISPLTAGVMNKTTSRARE